MSKSTSKKNIVTIGGGTGTFTVLSALKSLPVHLSAIVSMADDGGSTGRLRDELGVLPPGDIRRALIALSESEKILRELFNYRFEEGELSGHNFGNLFLSTLEKITGSFEKSLEETIKLLRVKGDVLPVTLDNVRLCAETHEGKIIFGEKNISNPQQNNNTPKIKKIFLRPKANLNPKIYKIIEQANLIIIGPGDLYSSIMPNFLVNGLTGAIKSSKAKKLYICNLMTRHGETDGFKASDFVKKIVNHIPESHLDYVLIHEKKPEIRRLKLYSQENSQFVDYDKNNFKNINIKLVAGDFITPDNLIRHDQNKIKTCFKIIKKQR